MIVAVCADKGAPGVTTLSLTMGLVWPGERVVLEADPSGADLPLWLENVGGGHLRPEPSVLSLAADARVGVAEANLPRYAQQSALGVPVIAGAMSAESFWPMRELWPSIAKIAAGWTGTVIADLGRLQPGHAAVPLAQAASAVVVAARPTVDGLYHLRDRVNELTHLLGAPAHHRTPVIVAIRVPPKEEREGISQVRSMLAATGSPVSVVSAVSEDPRTVQALLERRLDRRAAKRPLLSSVTALARSLLDAFPELSRPWHPALEPELAPYMPAEGRPSTRGDPPGNAIRPPQADRSPGASP